jgi:hypothetical protein
VTGEPSAADVEQLLGDVRAGLHEIVTCVEAICRAAEAALAGLPAAAAGGARTQVAELRWAAADVDSGLAELLAAPGDPALLRRAGAEWLNRVCAPVSRLVGVATLNAAQVDDHWTGTAAEAYRSTLPAQQAALAAVVATGQDVDATLAELAAALTKFWVAIGSACLATVFALAAALTSAGTLVGAPVAVGAGLAGMAALVTAGNSALSGLTDVVVVAATRSATLERRLADSGAFPMGAWPRSTTAIGRDWQIR